MTNALPTSTLNPVSLESSSCFPHPGKPFNNNRDYSNGLSNHLVQANPTAPNDFLSLTRRVFPRILFKLDQRVLVKNNWFLGIVRGLGGQPWKLH